MADKDLEKDVEEYWNPTNRNDKQSLLQYLVSLWDIQESLLQNYRIFFITCQAIFIATTSIFLLEISKAPDKTILFLLLPIFWAGLFLNYKWGNITYTRGKCVDFFQKLVRDVENLAKSPKVNTSNGLTKYPFNLFKEFQGDFETTKKNKKQNGDTLAKALNPHEETGRTRISLNLDLPIIFFYSGFSPHPLPLVYLKVTLTGTGVLH